MEKQLVRGGLNNGLDDGLFGNGGQRATDGDLTSSVDSDGDGGSDDVKGE